MKKKKKKKQLALNDETEELLVFKQRFTNRLKTTPTDHMHAAEIKLLQDLISLYFFAS